MSTRTKENLLRFLHLGFIFAHKEQGALNSVCSFLHRSRAVEVGIGIKSQTIHSSLSFAPILVILEVHWDRQGKKLESDGMHFICIEFTSTMIGSKAQNLKSPSENRSFHRPL